MRFHLKFASRFGAFLSERRSCSPLRFVFDELDRIAPIDFEKSATTKKVKTGRIRRSYAKFLFVLVALFGEQMLSLEEEIVSSEEEKKAFLTRSDSFCSSDRRRVKLFNEFFNSIV